MSATAIAIATTADPSPAPFARVPVLPASAGAAVIGEALEQHGAVVVTGVLSAERAAELRQALADLVSRESAGQAGQSSVRTGELLRKDPRFRGPLCDPLLLAVWRRLLGPDLVCSTWTGNTVMPGAGGVFWHVDHPYWAMKEPYPTGCWLAGQTIWMLDDFTAENGATAVVPGSHLRPRGPTGEQWYPDAQIIEAPAGSVLLAHGLFWHTSRRNASPAPRHALLGMYARCVLVPQEDMPGQCAQLSDPSDEERLVLGATAYRSRNIET